MNPFSTVQCKTIIPTKHYYHLDLNPGKLLIESTFQENYNTSNDQHYNRDSWDRLKSSYQTQSRVARVTIVPKYTGWYEHLQHAIQKEKMAELGAIINENGIERYNHSSNTLMMHNEENVSSNINNNEKTFEETHFQFSDQIESLFRNFTRNSETSSRQFPNQKTHKGAFQQALDEIIEKLEPVHTKDQSAPPWWVIASQDSKTQLYLNFIALLRQYLWFVDVFPRSQRILYNFIWIQNALQLAIRIIDYFKYKSLENSSQDILQSKSVPNYHHKFMNYINQNSLTQKKSSQKNITKEKNNNLELSSFFNNLQQMITQEKENNIINSKLNQQHTQHESNQIINSINNPLISTDKQKYNVNNITKSTSNAINIQESKEKKEFSGNSPLQYSDFYHRFLYKNYQLRHFVNNNF